MSPRGQTVPLSGLGGGPSPITLLIFGFITGGTDITATWYRAAQALTLKNVVITAKAAPGTTAVTFDILRSTDGGVSFATLLTTTKLTLPVGDQTITLVSGVDIVWNSALAEGDLLRVDVLSQDDGFACYGFIVSLAVEIP